MSHAAVACTPASPQYSKQGKGRKERGQGEGEWARRGGMGTSSCLIAQALASTRREQHKSVVAREEAVDDGALQRPESREIECPSQHLLHPVGPRKRALPHTPSVLENSATTAIGAAPCGHEPLPTVVSAPTSWLCVLRHPPAHSSTTITNTTRQVTLSRQTPACITGSTAYITHCCPMARTCACISSHTSTRTADTIRAAAADHTSSTDGGDTGGDTGQSSWRQDMLDNHTCARAAFIRVRSTLGRRCGLFQSNGRARLCLPAISLLSCAFPLPTISHAVSLGLLWRLKRSAALGSGAEV
jgi:hypothetical protein